MERQADFIPMLTSAQEFLLISNTDQELKNSDLYFPCGCWLVLGVWLDFVVTLFLLSLLSLH